MKRSAVPAELKAPAQWVCWKSVPNPKKPKPDKAPVDPRTGNLAIVTDPNTWTDFTTAFQHHKANGFPGIGFVLTVDDPYCVIDLDGCRNFETGAIEPWAQAINTRTEISPSGTGVHLILKGNVPGPRCRTGSIEMYDHARYITMTACLPCFLKKTDERRLMKYEKYTAYSLNRYHARRERCLHRPVAKA